MAHAGKSGRRRLRPYKRRVRSEPAPKDETTPRTLVRRGARSPINWGLAAQARRLFDEAEIDALTYTTFPAAHPTKRRSTSSIERLNGEIKRRHDNLGIFPNEAATVRLGGAILREQNDEWVV